MLTGTRRRGPAPADLDGQWSRTRLLAALAGLAALAVVLLVGVGLWVWFRLHPSGPSATEEGTPATAAQDRGTASATQDAQQLRRDALAAAAMPRVPAEAAKPAVLSSRDPGVIVLPASTGTGPAGVASGFAHTPAGALAQLAAIDKNVLDTATVDHAREVIAGWAAPGGPTGQSWTAVKALVSFHSAAGLSGGASAGVALRATPMMGLVKATEGPDWAVVCVDFEVDATITQTARIAAADCQRMAWAADRWVIAAGLEPAPPPSIWPGTDAAIDAGYRNLRQEQPQ